MAVRQSFALVLAVVTTAVSAAGAIWNGEGLHLTKGQHRVFAADSLRVCVQDRCTSDGIRIAAHLAARGHAVATVADGPKGSAILTVKTLADDGVIASCL